METNTYLSLSEAAQKIPTASGKPPSTQTLFRWCTKGCRGIKLSSLRFGRRIVVTPEALQTFATELSAAWQENRPQSPPRQTSKTKGSRTAAQRAKAVAKAEGNLRRKGVLPATLDEE